MVSCSLWSCQLSRSTFSENPNGRFRRRQAMDDMPLKIRQTHTQVCSLNMDVPSKIQLLMECHYACPRNIQETSVKWPLYLQNYPVKLHTPKLPANLDVATPPRFALVSCGQSIHNKIIKRPKLTKRNQWPSCNGVSSCILCWNNLFFDFQ